MRKFLVVALIFLLNFSFLFASTERISQLIAQNSVVVGIIKTDYKYIPSIVPYYKYFSNYIDTNSYVVLNYDENLVPVVYIPLSVDWNTLISSLPSQQSLSDSSILIEDRVYVKRELSNYIAVLDVRYMNNYNNQKKGLDSQFSQILSNFLIEISNSQTSGMIIRPTPQLLRNFVFSNIKVIDEKYNFLIDIDYVYAFLYNDDRITGRISLKSSTKLANLSLPIKERTRIQLPKDVQFYLGLSVSPRLVVDLLEVFFPDLIATFPSIKQDIVKSLSGTIFLSLFSPIYTQPIDTIAIIGVKSQREADKLIKSLLGIIGKYKVITVANSRVIELDFSGQIAYLLLRDKDIVISTRKESLENYIIMSRKNELNSLDLPTLSIQGRIDHVAIITDSDRQNYRRIFGVEPPNQIKLSVEVDNNLRVVYFDFVQN